MYCVAAQVAMSVIGVLAYFAGCSLITVSPVQVHLVLPVDLLTSS